MKSFKQIKKEKRKALMLKTIQLEKTYDLYVKTKKAKYLIRWYSIMAKPIKISE